MKRKIGIIITLLFITLSTSVAQNLLDGKNYEKPKKDSLSQVERVEIFRDRLVIDVFQSFWLGMPAAVNSAKFNPGVNVSMLWDIKKKSKFPLSFGIGAGVNYHTQNSNALIGIDSRSWTTLYNVLPQMDEEYKICRLDIVSLYIPLELRYRHHSGFKFSVGARLGSIVSVGQRYRGKDLSGKNQMLDYKDYQIFNKMKYHFDFYARIGWEGLGIFYSYQLTPLFESGKGPQVRPMSVGISISPF
ncbi:MAG: hypothetical protein PHR19_08660 [Bacteroidales bacterium]|jgi:hypothetical protein|nr:hypothetical protein [Bacteroidales bacterium]HHT52954.1 hypothetical protein [Bacteroidales bacterium]